MIYVTNHLSGLHHIPALARALRSESACDFVISKNPPQEGGWVLSWAYPQRSSRNAVIEYGFFWEAMHIDTHGLYRNSSFNEFGAMTEVLAFKAPRTAREIVFSGDMKPSKYQQGMEDVDWAGIVLPLQIPEDRSVTSIGSQEDYWSFVRGAAKRYGKYLLLKAHPMMLFGDRTTAIQIANEYGCRFAETNHSCLRKCRFVLTYNSTFCVDSWIHEVPVAQFAPGYFHKTGAVCYTAGEYPDSVPGDHNLTGRLLDFLMWRYCFHSRISGKQWLAMLRLFAESDERFPLTEEFCYANSVCSSHEFRQCLPFESAYQTDRNGSEMSQGGYFYGGSGNECKKCNGKCHHNSYPYDDGRRPMAKVRGGK